MNSIILTSVVSSGIVDPKQVLQICEELCRSTTVDQAGSGLKLEGFVAFGMESYTDPGPGENNKLSLDLRFDERFMTTLRNLGLEQQAAYRLNYYRISKLIRDGDELLFKSVFTYKPQSTASASVMCELETGIFNSYRSDDNSGDRILEHSFLSPATLHCGLGTVMSAGKIRLEFSVPDIKVSLMINDKVFDANLSGLQSMTGSGEYYRIETGYKLGLSSKYTLTPEIDVDTKGRLFIGNDDFRKPEFDLDQEVGIKLSKIVRTAIQTRLSFDGETDSHIRVRSLIRLGLYF